MIDLGNWGCFRFRGTWGFLRLWNKIECYRFRDKVQMEIAWNAPLWLVNWCVVRAATRAIEANKGPSDIGYEEMWKATDPRPERRTIE